MATMTPERADYLAGTDRWFAASVGADASPDPLAGAPAWARRAVLEGRQRNAVGLCFRADCGQPLHDETACAEHAEHATDGERLEARMRRHGLLPSRRTKRYY